MEKRRVSVSLEGRSYIVITSDSEEYVRQVAGEVSESILNASRSAKQLDVRDCAILAATNNGKRRKGRRQRRSRQPGIRIWREQPGLP